ncbi:hypothetical protein NQ315_002510 [Exocentrus adspersus]|uniref:KANSL3 helical domain-containing protein n=2 Tax=Exocentrus adspersus TaxID=1586481 RepID=A0AAV8VKU5_9CUCU|nr:hypothetical protein NQ315_002510 [Exocentrus adspersus]
MMVHHSRVLQVLSFDALAISVTAFTASRADLPPLNPYCFSLSLPITSNLLLILPAMMPFRTFPTVSSRHIGLKQGSVPCFPGLRKRTKFATFHASGSLPSFRSLLYILTNIPGCLLKIACQISIVRPSGPGAFPFLIFAITFPTSSAVTCATPSLATNWTPAQNRIFNGMVNILNSFNLSKLAQIDVHNEPLIRRTVIDKAVQRVRRLLATISWDPKIVQWLHQILLDNLGPSYLGAYLDILQTLKSKLPTFVDKMMYAPNSSLRTGPLSNASLHPLLESTWDPVASSLLQDKPKKLPSNPVIVLVPSAPILSKRNLKWIKLFSHLATVVTISTNFGKFLPID